MKERESRLVKALGRTDIIALGFGTMVGWSWVVLATTWVSQAGFMGTIVAFLIGGLLIFLIGLTYGELTAALPLSGGEVVYAYRAKGKNFAWVVGWIMTLAYLGVAAWEGIALATAVNHIFSIPHKIPLWEIGGNTVYLTWALVGIAGAVVMLVLNLFGTKPAIIFQVMATVSIIAICIMLLLGGITFGNIENMGKPFVDASGFFYVMLIIPSMLIGFDVIPQSAEEMNISPKDTGKMLLVCIAISLAWYILVIIGIALAAPVEIRMSGSLPMADIMTYLYGNNIFGTILVFVGILGILTSWNGFFMGATRIIFAMGRGKMLPEIFGSLGKKYKTPWAATLLVGAICIVMPLLGKRALFWLVNISSICALFSYCCVAFSFTVLKKNEPELERPIKIKGGKKLGILICILSGLYFCIYILMTFKNNNFKNEIILISIWICLGVCLYLYSRIKYKNVSYIEREILIFGESLARFIKKGN